MTVDQALTGHWLSSGRNPVLHTPDEYDEAFAPFRKGDPPWREEVEERVSQVNDPHKLLRSWARNHDTFLVGDHVAVATRVRDMTNLMDTEGRPNETTIYRGSLRSPQELKELDPTFPQSFTDDLHVARSFTGKNYMGKRGKIFKMAPDHARGLSLQDFDANIRTVGQSSRRENEFLVDPRSIQ